MPRVLFDQGVPNRLRRHLSGHTVETAYERGWSTLTNGDLLRAIEEAGFDIFVTADKNIRFQQNLTGRPFGIVVLGTNIWPVIALNIKQVASAVDRAPPGSVTTVDIPMRSIAPEP